MVGLACPNSGAGALLKELLNRPPCWGCPKDDWPKTGAVVVTPNPPKPVFVLAPENRVFCSGVGCPNDPKVLPVEVAKLKGADLFWLKSPTFYNRFVKLKLNEISR